MDHQPEPAVPAARQERIARDRAKGDGLAAVAITLLTVALIVFLVSRIV